MAYERVLLETGREDQDPVTTPRTGCCRIRRACRSGPKAREMIGHLMEARDGERLKTD